MFYFFIKLLVFFTCLSDIFTVLAEYFSVYLLNTKIFFKKTLRLLFKTKNNAILVNINLDDDESLYWDALICVFRFCPLVENWSTLTLCVFPFTQASQNTVDGQLGVCLWERRDAHSHLKWPQPQQALPGGTASAGVQSAVVDPGHADHWIGQRWAGVGDVWGNSFFDVLWATWGWFKGGALFDNPASAVFAPPLSIRSDPASYSFKSSPASNPNQPPPTFTTGSGSQDCRNYFHNLKSAFSL